MDDPANGEDAAELAALEQFFEAEHEWTLG
jgi:hypothetical protein